MDVWPGDGGWTAWFCCRNLGSSAEAVGITCGYAGSGMGCGAGLLARVHSGVAVSAHYLPPRSPQLRISAAIPQLGGRKGNIRFCYLIFVFFDSHNLFSRSLFN